MRYSTLTPGSPSASVSAGEKDAVLGLRQILHHDQHRDRVVEFLAQRPMHVLAPGPLQPHRLEQQRVLARDLEVDAALEAAAGVGLIEFMGIDRAAHGAGRPIHRRLEHAADIGGGVVHEIAAQRRTLDARGKQQTRRADAIAGDDDAARRLAIVAPVGPAVDQGGGAPRLDDDLLHDAALPELDARRDRPGPIGHVDGGLGPAHAADLAGAAVIAARPAAMGARIDRRIDRPPMPAQPVEAPGRRQAEPAEGKRRLAAGGLGRVGRIARQPAHPHGPVVQIVIGLEGLIAEGPVVADAVEAAGAEIGGMQAGKMRRPIDGRAADAVPHQGLQRRGRIVDRIVGGKGIAAGLQAQIGRGGPGAQRRALPLPRGRRHGRGIDPAAALQAEDAKTRRPLGEPRGKGGRGEARPHHGHIDGLQSLGLGHASPMPAASSRHGSISPRGFTSPGRPSSAERETLADEKVYLSCEHRGRRGDFLSAGSLMTGHQPACPRLYPAPLSQSLQDDS